MLNDQTASRREEENDDNEIRDIHALTPPQPPSAGRAPRREAWETGSHGSSVSIASENLSENFTTMSREFNALVIAGSSIEHGESDGANLARIGEDEVEEINPLAIVPDNHPLDPVPSPRRGAVGSSSTEYRVEDVSLQRVKKEETESKIIAWQTAKIAKVNNRFKREDAIINGWEGEQVQKANTWMKKVERKLEEKRARAMEKMQNDIARAHRKAGEKRASEEAKRGIKVARVLELSNLMKAVGRTPSKRSFF